MADRGIRIPILADVADFLRGSKKITDELDDIADEFKDVTRAGEKSADDVADAFRGAARKTEKAFDDLDAGQAFGDVRDEANDTAREVAASFTGGIDEVAGGFQELAANAGAVFGPLGLAAGAAAAAGLGILFDEFQKSRERVEAVTKDLFQTMVDEAGRLSADFRKQKVMEALVSGEDAQKAIQQIQRVAGPQGLRMLDEALGGSKTAADELIQLLASEQAGRWINRNEDAIQFLNEYAQGWNNATANARIYFNYVNQQLVRTGQATPAQVRENNMNRP